jgi:hypothetical protein
VWTALTVGIGAMLAGMFVSVVVLLAAMFASGAVREGFDEDTLAKLMSRPGMVFAIFLPGQLVFLLAAFGAAALSPQPFRQRLGFVRSHLPGWAILLFVAATPFCGFLGEALMMLTFGEPSGQLKMIQEIAGSQRGLMSAATVFLLAMAPPFTEECLFRGYVQRRLLERWRPAWAIAVSALIFTAAHLDPGHMLAVLPIGVWLGVIAWRTGAVWPAILCHAAQNLLATIMMFATESPDEPTDYTDPVVLAILAVLFTLFAASVWLLARGPRQRPPEAGFSAPELMREYPSRGDDHESG